MRIHSRIANQPRPIILSVERTPGGGKREEADVKFVAGNYTTKRRNLVANVPDGTGRTSLEVSHSRIASYRYKIAERRGGRRRYTRNNVGQLYCLCNTQIAAATSILSYCSYNFSAGKYSQKRDDRGPIVSLFSDAFISYL